MISYFKIEDTNLDTLLRIVENLVPQKKRLSNFILEQITNGCKSNRKSRVWSDEMISFCLNIWAR